MSNIKVEGFKRKSSEILAELSNAFDAFSEAERKSQIKKTGGIFEMQIKNSNGEEETWTVDLKKEGRVYRGKAQPKADVAIILNDDIFVQLTNGKLDGQKAFMTGKLKTKGNIMLAMKLDGVLRMAKSKGKL